MKTINTLIEEIQQYNSIQKQINTEDRIQAVYSKYPELADIDRKIVEINKDIILASIDFDSIKKADYETRKKIMMEKRNKFISEHNIDPEFDEEKALCDKCGDTGYVTGKNGTKKVCSCMRLALEECYNDAGLKDFSSYSFKSFDKGMFGDGKKRIEKLNSMIDLNSTGKTSLYLYSDSVQSGKTFLTVCAVKVLITTGHSAFYIKSEDIVDLRDDEFEFAQYCEFLAIDDFSMDATSRFGSASAINSILESRIASGRKTVVVSSSSKENLIGGLDVRIAGKVKNSTEI